MKIRIGTRGSALALWQADHVAERLRAAWPGLETERVIFKTTGDRVLDRPLAEIGGKGLFTKELEVALLEGGIDIAVHSLKDMPTVLPEGLVLGAIPERADPRDCIVTRAGESPDAARTIGTASLRRACLARRRWPQAGIEAIRGNVPTRVERVLEAGERRVDAVVLAMAGLERIGLLARTDVDFHPLDAAAWIPAVGQAALAIECRGADDSTRAVLLRIHDAHTARCVTAERALLRAVEGDCRVPVGALASVQPGGGLRLSGFVGAPDGSEVIEHTAEGDDAAALGAAVAERLLAAGGRRVLDALKPRPA